MASSFITKDNKYGFWIYDNILQVVCKLLSSVIKNFNQDKLTQWEKELGLLLELNAKGFFPSYMHLNLEEFLTTNERIALFINYCDITQKLAIEYGQFIELVELKTWYNKSAIGHEWRSPIEVQRLIKVLDYLKALANDKITIKVNDKIDYEF